MIINMHSVCVSYQDDISDMDNIEYWLDTCISVCRLQEQTENGYQTDEYIFYRNICNGRAEISTKGYITYFEDKKQNTLWLNHDACKKLDEIKERLLIEDEYYDNRSDL